MVQDKETAMDAVTMREQQTCRDEICPNGAITVNSQGRATEQGPNQVFTFLKRRKKVSKGKRTGIVQVPVQRSD